jgi:hypothetical protein
MADWTRDLSSDYDDTPTVVPSGCEPAERGESCGKTDCPSCGIAEVHLFCANARHDICGVIALGREIVRVRYRPEGVTLGDLARVRFLYPLHVDDDERSRAYAWAEGVIAALDGDRCIESRDFGDDPSKQAAFVIGFALVQLYLFREHLSEMEAEQAAVAAEMQQRYNQRWIARLSRASQARPSDFDRRMVFWPITPDEFTPCTAPEKARRLGIPSAAGDLSPHRRPTAQPGQRAESGPGSESRAQHCGYRGR